MRNRIKRASIDIRAGSPSRVEHRPPRTVSTSSRASGTAMMRKYLRENLGGALASALTRADGTDTIPAHQALRDAYEITRTLRAVESPEVVQAWLLGMNPMLDDRAPAVVLREDPAAVLRAARFFAANG